MPQYLVAINLPAHFNPSQSDPAMMDDIHALNKEMIAAGVRLFAGGLSPAGHAKSLRAQTDGKLLMTDGPYLEAKEHRGGFLFVDCGDVDQAVAWGRKAVKA